MGLLKARGGRVCISILCILPKSIKHLSSMVEKHWITAMTIFLYQNVSNDTLKVTCLIPCEFEFNVADLGSVGTKLKEKSMARRMDWNSFPFQDGRVCCFFVEEWERQDWTEQGAKLVRSTPEKGAGSWAPCVSRKCRVKLLSQCDCLRVTEA